MFGRHDAFRKREKLTVLHVCNSVEKNQHPIRRFDLDLAFSTNIKMPQTRHPSNFLTLVRAGTLWTLRFLWVLIAIPVFCQPVAGQFVNDFESPVTSWQLRETDCRDLRKGMEHRRVNETEAQNRVEQFFFDAGQGTKIFVSHEIPAAFIIPDLQASVRVKGERAGIQLMVRVVLPETNSPSGDGPMRTLIPGPIYTDAGRWQNLAIGHSDDMAEKLQEKIWVLRREYGRHVSDKNAFIDAVVLNLYSEPGTQRCQIDDLVVSGIVDASKVKENGAPKKNSKVQPVGFQENRESRPSLSLRDGSVVEVKQKPFFALIARHHGEPFSFLKSLGFNTIELASAATDQQLREAEQLDMWLICPPPASAGLRDISFSFDRVLAWTTGSRLSGKNLKNVRERIREIRESDLRTGRPVVGHVQADWRAMGQELDVIMMGVSPIGSSFIASGYSDWIRKRSQLIGNSKPIWADVQAEISPSMSRQVASIATQVPPVPVDAQQIKFLVYQAIAGGSRGLRFVTHSRLDAADPESRLRAQTIQWAIESARQLEPWAVAGALMNDVDTGNHRLKVTAINNPQSRLLIIQRPTHHEQYCCGDVPLESISFVDSATTFTNRVYRLTELGMTPLANLRNHGGIQITLEDCPFVAAVVMTQDPSVIAQHNDPSLRASQMLNLHTQITSQWIAIMQLVDQQMSRLGRTSASASGALNESINAFRKANELMISGTPAMGIGFLNRADERLAFARRELLTEPLGKFQSKTSSPFLTHVSLVPIHFQVANQLSGAVWEHNGLPGGDFENLPLMTKKRLGKPASRTPRFSRYGPIVKNCGGGWNLWFGDERPP